MRALLLFLALAQPAKFKLAPAVAVEAEDFSIKDGWKVVKNGQANYKVDIIGFNHLSGERLLSLPAKSSGTAWLDLDIPEDGIYRLWVRYEYPAFCDCTFTASIEQGGKEIASHVMGTPKGLRYAFGDPAPKAQHDPSWGPEGLMEEPATVRGLKKGKARLVLKGAKLPDMPGVSADRNIDLAYLTRDVADSWRAHYTKEANLYPILGAFRDSCGPRWEVKFTNRGKEKRSPRVQHVYNRIPWGMSETASFPSIGPGESTGWTGLLSQDTSHSSMVDFNLAGQPLELEIRPVGGKAMTFKDERAVRLYLPPYPGKGEEPITPEVAIARILAALKKSKAPGRKPTAPLCYGGWMPVGAEGEYGKKHAELYAGMGFVSMHPALSGPKVMENLKAVGIGPSKSWMAMGYRNPPTKDSIAKAKVEVARRGMEKHLRFFDYGDEIGFSEWMDMMATEDVAKAKAAGATMTPAQAVNTRWGAWLLTNRKDKQVKDYWLPTWGAFDLKKLRPDSSAEAAKLNPRLYIDSLLFYEEAAIAFAADGAKAVKAEFGADVLCGANYSCHPFYYPSSTMYIKWFRGGAADMGRHSEYFWQVAQAGPMINGYVAEHFRAGLRDVKGGVLRQYTMPHAPGNTDASFLRSCFTHLAHGATMLDFFGIGPNETFTENHIDFRAISRFKAVRDVTHSVGLVEDLLPESKPLPSKVALLVSESTERWDMAGIATDKAGHAHFGKDFRKTRTLFHLERLGLWKALTFAGSTPDLVTEEDVIRGQLGEAKLLVVVGDHWKRGTIPALEKWVKAGGVVLSTAGAGVKDEYGEPIKGWVSKEAKIGTPFIRPRQELPFLKPSGTVKGEGWVFPILAASEEKPALVRTKMGKGEILHVGALPGLAYLWSALQPPAVPDRGPGTHTVPTKWDEGAAKLVKLALDAAKVEPDIVAEPALLDARLLVAKGGYVLPVASYSGKDEEKATLTVRVPSPVKRAVSAAEGELRVENGKGTATITLKKLRYGDVVRLEK